MVLWLEQINTWRWAGCDVPGGVLGGLVLRDKHVKSGDIVASRVWAEMHPEVLETVVCYME